MIKSMFLSACVFLTSASAFAEAPERPVKGYLCQGDKVASIAGYRTNFREKNRLKRILFVVRTGQSIQVRYRDSEEVPFALTASDNALVSSDPANRNTFRLNPETLRFMATSPGDFLSGGREEDPWLIIGACKPI